MRSTFRSLAVSAVFAGFFLAKSIPAADYHGVESTGITQTGQLDMPAIRKAYHESEFDWVKMVLESYIRKGSHVTKDEKTFAYKYLGVIYASEATAKNRAESYFNLLLNLSPDIELTDMYAPKSIEEFFHEVKVDWVSKQEYDKTHDALGKSIEPHGTQKNSAVQPAKNNGNSTGGSNNNTSKMREENTSNAWVWWGSGIAAVGVGVGVYLWMQRAPEKTTVTDTLSGGL